MNVRRLIPLSILVIPALASGDTRLEGAWRSNAILTIRSIEEVRKLTDEERERFDNVLGNMTMTFGPDAVAVDWGEPGSKPMSVPYEVLDSGEDFVTVEFDDRLHQAAPYPGGMVRVFLQEWRVKWPG